MKELKATRVSMAENETAGFFKGDWDKLYSFTAWLVLTIVLVETTLAAYGFIEMLDARSTVLCLNLVAVAQIFSMHFAAKALKALKDSGIKPQ